MIQLGRYTAAYDGPLAVFVIGMRVNRLFSVHKWFPVLRAMTAMLKELEADPESGFLGSQFTFSGWRIPVSIQYWRSFEHLHAYAHDRIGNHMPAWRAFNSAVGGDGTVGIYHETYIIEPGRFETIYAHMTPFGLGKAGGVRPATGSRKEARGRLSLAACDGGHALQLKRIAPLGD